MSTLPARPKLLPRSDFSATYALDRTHINQLMEELNRQTFLDNITLLVSTPIENLISLRYYPLDMADFFWTAPEGEEQLDPVETSIQINIVTMETKGISLGYGPAPLLSGGTVHVTPSFHNFLDYAPYTKIECYIPYIGFVTLDTNEVMNKAIKLEYAVDVMTGTGTAYLTVGTEGLDGTFTWEKIVYIGDCKLGIDIPIGGANAPEVARNNLVTGINAAGGIIGTVAAGTVGGTGAAVMAGMKTLASTTVSAIQSNQVHVHKGSIGSCSNGMYGPQNAFLAITRPRIAEPSDYAAQFGRPSGKTAALETLHGYTVVEKVRVKGFASATQEEISEVERLLKTGVILPDPASN